MVHGTRSCYVSGCRRPECREANALYQKQWRAERRGSKAARPAVAAPPTGPEDAAAPDDQGRADDEEPRGATWGDVGAHLEQLRAAGMTDDDIVAAAGVTIGSLRFVDHHMAQRRTEPATRPTTTALLAVPLPDDEMRRLIERHAQEAGS